MVTSEVTCLKQKKVHPSDCRDIHHVLTAKVQKKTFCKEPTKSKYFMIQFDVRVKYLHIFISQKIDPS